MNWTCVPFCALVLLDDIVSESHSQRHVYPKTSHSQRRVESHCLNVPRVLVRSVVSRRVDRFQESLSVQEQGCSEHPHTRFLGHITFWGVGMSFRVTGMRTVQGTKWFPSVPSARGTKAPPPPVPCSPGFPSPTTSRLPLPVHAGVQTCADVLAEFDQSSLALRMGHVL